MFQLCHILIEHKAQNNLLGHPPQRSELFPSQNYFKLTKLKVLDRHVLDGGGPSHVQAFLHAVLFPSVNKHVVHENLICGGSINHLPTRPLVLEDQVKQYDIFI
jgi:hypothetical protein